ncbi:helix-turn-helix transcriptional regulator [uncultured Bacteroides sp.]|uniref:helix-turn-helix domain-containing protein n=1 Tax=uncultured Bacteroides sp. TaxID=162156 RepID=UPI00260AD4C2|nr:helix-turn-helix transcriptional regulator [uncultured Bacteroides sp.]
MVESKNESVLDLLISQRDENEYAKVESRMGIAVKIAKALERKGMTQKELAEKLGKRPSEISEWLTGNHNFTDDTLFLRQVIKSISKD